MPTDADLIDPATPPDQLPKPPVIAGNYPDPDAAVLDSLVESAAEPPTGAALPVTAPAPVPVPVKRPTRLMTGSMAIQAAWGPVQLLPVDVYRKHLRVRISSVTPADYIRLSDDAGKVQSLGGSALIYNTNTIFELPDHTGPLWVSAVDAVGPVTVSWVTVTE